MKKYVSLLCALLFLACAKNSTNEKQGIAVIRVNQLGYLPETIKVAVFGAKTNTKIISFTLHEANTNKKVFHSENPDAKGAYGPFESTYRLNFSDFKIPGAYYVQANGVKSPVFLINEDVYDHTADFLLEYLRQQRCGYNPYLTDSCHLDDGYILYNPAKKGQRIDVTGGWHDATDYLQYTATSANAVF